MSDKAAAPLPTFVLKPPTDFWWEVRVPIAGDSDYTFARLDVLFAALPQPELDKLRGVGLSEGEPLPTDEQICQRVVRGWRHLPDEHGNPLPFSAEVLAKLLAVPMMRSALVSTFMAASSGMAARKNA